MTLRVYRLMKFGQRDGQGRDPDASSTYTISPRDPLQWPTCRLWTWQPSSSGWQDSCLLEKLSLTERVKIGLVEVGCSRLSRKKDGISGEEGVACEVKELGRR